jgi:hypothetical protein
MAKKKFISFLVTEILKNRFIFKFLLFNLFLKKKIANINKKAWSQDTTCFFYKNEYEANRT